MTVKAEYRTTRVLSLSMTSVQINETLSKDWVIGFGYKINDFRFFNSRARLAAKNKTRKSGDGDGNDNNANAKKNSSSVTNKSKGFAHDLNLRLDISYRQQASITRDIATVTSTATSGNNAFKLAFAADYSLSKLLTMSFYYDRQSNNPLLSSSSYPTVTQDFGISMKFSLTR
jgi:cell surface protein SprA